MALHITITRKPKGSNESLGSKVKAGLKKLAEMSPVQVHIVSEEPELLPAPEPFSSEG